VNSTVSIETRLADSTRRFQVNKDNLKDHRNACQCLFQNLTIAGSRTLEDLLQLVREIKGCDDLAPDAIVHLAARMDDELPVPVLDLKLADRTDWTGIRLRFFAHGTDGKHTGHLVVRNVDAAADQGFTREQYLEMVKEHETCHVLQALGNRDADLMTPSDLSVCDGFVALLPMMAPAAGLSVTEATGAASRWFLQKFSNEVEVWDAVDYRYACEKASQEALDIENWRANAVCVILRHLIAPVVQGFLMAYAVPWSDWIGSVEEGIAAATRETFLARPVRFGSSPAMPLSCLQSIRVENGLLHNERLDRRTYTQLTAFLPRPGPPAALTTG